MKKISLIAIFVILSFQSVWAQQTKIGFVDPQAVLTRMPEMAAVEQRLRNFAEKKQKEIIDKQTNLRQQVDLYQQKQSVISAESRQKEEERLARLNQEVMQLQNQSQQEMQEKQAELIGPLLEQIQNAINAVSKDLGLSYVFNSVTSEGEFIILYASDEMKKNFDITEKVMDKLGV